MGWKWRGLHFTQGGALKNWRVLLYKGKVKATEMIHPRRISAGHDISAFLLHTCSSLPWWLLEMLIKFWVIRLALSLNSICKAQKGTGILFTLVKPFTCGFIFPANLPNRQKAPKRKTLWTCIFFENPLLMYQESTSECDAAVHPLTDLPVWACHSKRAGVFWRHHGACILLDVVNILFCGRRRLNHTTRRLSRELLQVSERPQTGINLDIPRRKNETITSVYFWIILQVNFEMSEHRCHRRCLDLFPKFRLLHVLAITSFALFLDFKRSEKILFLAKDRVLTSTWTPAIKAHSKERRNHKTLFCFKDWIHFKTPNGQNMFSCHLPEYLQVTKGKTAVCEHPLCTFFKFSSLDGCFGLVVASLCFFVTGICLQFQLFIPFSMSTTP